MDSFGNCIWDLWSSGESDSDSNELILERRQYHMQERLDHFNKWDEIEFFRRFRLQKQTVANILDLIRPQLSNRSERSRNLTSMAKLLLALRFYASGTMLITIGDFVGVSKSTASVAVRQISFAIASLRKNFIKMPQTDTELAEASLAFYGFARFPRVIGAIDCTHVPIQSPGNKIKKALHRKQMGKLVEFLNFIYKLALGIHTNNSLLRLFFILKAAYSFLCTLDRLVPKTLQQTQNLKKLYFMPYD